MGLGWPAGRKTLFTQPTVAHYAGTPQSRSPLQIGPHGCTVVEVRRPRETRLRFIPCDVVRCHHERVLVSAAASWDDLQDILAQRVGEMRSQTPTLPLLVRWTLAAADGGVDREALAALGTKASNWLKKQFGYQSEPCWPVSVVVDAGTQIPASAYEEDTLLGDYLRAVRAVQEDRQLAVIDSPCVPDATQRFAVVGGSIRNRFATPGPAGSDQSGRSVVDAARRRSDARSHAGHPRRCRRADQPGGSQDDGRHALGKKDVQ